MALGQREEASKHLLTALEIDPNYEPALLHLHLLESCSDEELKEHFANVKELKDIKYYKDYGLEDGEKKSLIQELVK